MSFSLLKVISPIPKLNAWHSAELQSLRKFLVSGIDVAEVAASRGVEHCQLRYRTNHLAETEFLALGWLMRSLGFTPQRALSGGNALSLL
jgi:hypothetical protein